MSLSLQPLVPIQVTDPICDIHSVNSYAVLSGGNAVSFKNYPASAVSSATTTFSANPPAGNYIVDRNVQLTMAVRLTLTGTIKTNDNAFGIANPVKLLNYGKDAPSDYPLSSAIQTLQVQINNETVSIPLSQVFPLLNRYNIDTDLKVRDYSTTPNMPDMSFNYSDLQGTPNSPLNSYANCINGAAIPRGAYPFEFVTNPEVVATTAGVTVTAVVDFFITEPIFLSPFYFGHLAQDSQGFYNVSSLNFTVNFLAQAGFQMWSHDELTLKVGANSITSVINSVQVQFNNFSSPSYSYSVNQPALQFKYITPNLLTREKLGPLVAATYPYFKVDQYITDLATSIPYGRSAAPYSTNTIQLSSIPQKLFISAGPSQAALLSSCSLTRTNLVISGITIQWTNEPSLLSTATQQQLFLINAKNGGSQDYASWIGMSQANTVNCKNTGIGSILCLEFGTDIQLNDPTMAPGVKGNFQIQITLQLENKNSSLSWDNVPISLYLVTLSEGTFTVPSLGAANVQVGVLSGQDVLDAQSKPSVSYHSVAKAYGGANFFDSLGNFASKINNFLKESKIISTVAKAVPEGIPYASQIAKAVHGIAEPLGYGEPAGGRYTSRRELSSRVR